MSRLVFLDPANAKELQQRQPAHALPRKEKGVYRPGEKSKAGLLRMIVALRPQPAVEVIGLLGDAVPTVVPLYPLTAGHGHPLA